MRDGNAYPNVFLSSVLWCITDGSQQWYGICSILCYGEACHPQIYKRGARGLLSAFLKCHDPASYLTDTEQLKTGSIAAETAEMDGWLHGDDSLSK